MKPTFDEALDIVEQLSDDEQHDLIGIIRRRLAERGRERIIREVELSRDEFRRGLGKAMSVDEIMAAIRADEGVDENRP